MSSETLQSKSEDVGSTVDSPDQIPGGQEGNNELGEKSPHYETRSNESMRVSNWLFICLALILSLTLTAGCASLPMAMAGGAMSGMGAGMMGGMMDAMGSAMGQNNNNYNGNMDNMPMNDNMGNMGSMPMDNDTGSMPMDSGNMGNMPMNNGIANMGPRSMGNNMH
jgi:hypothetical protein